MKDKDRRDRIKIELRAAGASPYGLLKMESRYLPEVIHDDEHIKGVVYGLYDGGLGMLVATDHRVLFLDRKPMFMTLDEATYDAVSGVRLNRSGIFNATTLHTRLGDYRLSYVNRKCARKFVKYIESRRLEKDRINLRKEDKANKPALKSERVNTISIPFLSPQAIEFLREKGIGVLSTVDKLGNVHGAAVYYLADQLNRLFILTKLQTTKANNASEGGKVALTIVDEPAGKTLQIQGSIDIETENSIKEYVMSSISKPRVYSGAVHLPPVMKLSGEYVVLRVNPETAKYTDYKNLTTY